MNNEELNFNAGSFHVQFLFPCIEKRYKNKPVQLLKSAVTDNVANDQI